MYQEFKKKKRPICLLKLHIKTKKELYNFRVEKKTQHYLVPTLSALCLPLYNRKYAIIQCAIIKGPKTFVFRKGCLDDKMYGLAHLILPRPMWTTPRVQLSIHNWRNQGSLSKSGLNEIPKISILLCHTVPTV